MKFSIGKYSIGHYSYDIAYSSEGSSEIELTASISTTLSFSHSAGATLSPSAITNLTPAVLSTTIELSGTATIKCFIDLALYPVTKVSVGKSIQDQLWNCDVDMDGYQVINTTSLRHVTFAALDHAGVSRTLFSGIIPKTNVSLLTAKTSTGFSGYDYAWYLNQQYVPAANLHNTAGTNPADIIEDLLGGANWETTTGIKPYNIDQVATWGTTLNSKAFDFDISTTKWKAIEKICNYCRYLFVVKWVMVEGEAIPSAYFIAESDIDTALDLPAQVTFTWPSVYVEGKVSIDIKGDDRYNKVTVIGRNNAGAVYTASVSSDGVTNGDELAVEHIENSGSWTTQLQVTERAAEIYAYYSTALSTYKAKLIDRLDLELYQLIKFVDFDGIPETDMRITQIRYTVDGNNDGVKKRVEITFTDDAKWLALKRMYRADGIAETEAIVDSKIAAIPGAQLGTMTTIDGQSGTATLEAGNVVTVRVV